MKTAEEIKEAIEDITRSITRQQKKIEEYKEEIAKAAARGSLDFDIYMNGIKQAQQEIKQYESQLQILRWVVSED